MGSKIEAKALLAEAGRAGAADVDRPRPGVRVPGAGQGVRRAAAAGACGSSATPDTLAEAVASARREASSAFGDGTVFCERYVEQRPPHRGADRRRHARHRGAVRRAGVLDPAPPPEDRRGDAVAGGRPRSCASSCARAAVAAARAVGYVGVGTVEFLLDAEGELLLPGDEHPPAGRARRSPSASPASTWSGCSCSSPRAARCRSTGPPPIRGHAIEVRLCAEDPAYATGCRPPAPCTGSHVPRGGRRVPAAAAARPAARLRRPGRLGGRRALRLDAREARSPGRRPGTRPPGCSPARWPAPSSTAWSPTATCWSGCCATRRSASGEHRHRRSSTGTPRCSRRCCPRSTPSASPAWPPPWPAPPRAGPRRRCSARLPSGWRNVPSGSQTTVYDGPAGPVEVGYRLDRTGELAELVGARGRPGRAGPGRPRSGAGHRRPPAGRGRLGHRGPGRARRQRHPPRRSTSTGSATSPTWTARRVRWRCTSCRASRCPRRSWPRAR